MEVDMKNPITKAALLMCLAVTAASAEAHHSFAMFDQEKVITLRGTVKEFQWANPHSWIQLMVPGEGAKVTEWSVEMSGPGGLARKGWKPRTLKQGDKVTIVIHPLRDGGPGGSFVSVVLPSGETMGGDQFRVAK
jgi:hypothetical protein